MKVLFLGAGASKPAGYPVSAQLLPAIATHACAGPGRAGEDWARYDAFRRAGAATPFGPLLETRDPELAFSTLDLLERAEAAGVIPSRPDGAAGARAALLRCLLRYFEDRSLAETPGRRGYLRAALAPLAPGDVVITLNWDTTPERTLAEEGRWSPVDGYGIERPLRFRRAPPPLAGRDPGAVLPPSAVRVLKLHGSVGWRRAAGDPDGLRLHDRYLLDHLPVVAPPHGPVTLVDPQLDPAAAQDEVLIVPTFLKTVPAGLAMQRIWHAADRALREAAEIEVWGYSLPESDAAIRVLLTPVRFRLDEGGVRVRVHVAEDEAAAARWRALLGPRADVDGARLGEP